MFFSGVLQKRYKPRPAKRIAHIFCKSSKTFRSFTIFACGYNRQTNVRTAFSKYEGAGNDFILVDARDGRFRPDAGLVARLCDRHFGIGADGLMTLSSDARTDCSMRYYNADGSEGEMCGNGARCFALFADHLGIGGSCKRFAARDGLHEAGVRRTSDQEGTVVLSMRDVGRIDPCGEGWALDTGVPHYVEFVDDPAAVDVAGRGRAIRRDTARFPAGTNVDFVRIAGPGRLCMRTYERGVEAETLACGTGAVAAALAARCATGCRCDRFDVEVPGGKLTVTFDAVPGGEGEGERFVNIRLTGPARRVFSGEFDTANF